MSDTEAMDVDQPKLHNYSVWFFPGLNTPPGRLKLQQIDNNGLTLDKLKQLIVDEHKKRTTEGESSLRTVEDFDLLYNGNLLKRDSTLKLKPEAIVYVVKKSLQTQTKSISELEGAVSTSVIRDLAQGLRDAFMSTNFIKVIEKLTEPETLRNLFVVAPGLEADLAGIAIIQTPQLMFQISDREVLQRVATNRPWLVEALKHIIATAQADKVNKPGRIGVGGGLAAELLNSAYLDGGGGEEDEDEPEQQRVRSQPNFHGPITREQLTQALNALPIPGLPSSNPFMDYLTSPDPGQSRPHTAPPAASSSSGIWDSGFQQFLQNAFSSASASTTSSGGNTQNFPASQAPPPVSSNLQASTVNSPPITAEFLANAMQAAINQLPPDARADQFERFRQLAQQVASGNPAPQPSATLPASPAPSQSQPTGGEFQHELAQMRELGITNERLSILALRVSEGDVEIAVELILSGWDGSGAEGP